MRPRIFIGSSSEGLSVAERVKNFFSASYDCFLWTDDIFKNNESFLDTLLKSASLFDFAFLIFSADDMELVRDNVFDAPRDNVLFEYGLFLGRVGVDRAYIIAEKDIKIPTDMLGITYTRYETEDKIATATLEIGLEKLKKQIDDNVKLGHLGLLPSTVLAISYFEGFVKLTAEWLIENTNNIVVGDKKYEKGKLKIKLPDTLDTDIKKSAKIFYLQKKLNDTEIETKHRNYPIHFVVSEDNNALEIYDVPTILTGIDKAIDMYFRVGHIGKTEEQKLAEIHELNNFRQVLQLLINEDAFCRECVEII